MTKKQIAAQLYTIREFMKTPDEMEKSLKKVKETGYTSVQVSGVGPIEPERLKEIADSNGLTICATHVSFDRLKNDISNLIKEHKLWNCKYVGLGSMPLEYRGNQEGYRAFAKEASEIASKLDAEGLKFIYHNHKFEFEKFGDLTGMDILLSETDPRVFDFEIDTYWVQAGGASPSEWIKKVDGRMKVVHFKDMAIIQNEQVFAEVGEGNLNWLPIIKACRDVGVEWYAVEQDKCRQDPFVSLETSFRNLEKMI